MFVSERMKNALDGVDVNMAQMKALDLLTMGFKPETDIDLASLGKVLNHLVDEKRLCDQRQRVAEERTRDAEVQVAKLMRLNREKSSEIEDLRRLCEEKASEAKKYKAEAEKAWSVAEYYKNLAGMKTMAKKVIDRVSLTVNTFFVANTKTEPARVTVSDGGQYIENINNQSNNYGGR